MDGAQRRGYSTRTSLAKPALGGNALTILIDLGEYFLSVSEIMRLLAEIVIIAALIYCGWNKPFKEQVARANTTITSKLHGVGSKLQKNQDPSVRRY
jgi:hypothetical protein